MSICENYDCTYYSTFTSTCDYTLLRAAKRPCAIDGCTEYRAREERRPWMCFWPPVPRAAEQTAAPEPAAEPPEPIFVFADCGHEVYEGEILYEWEDGATLCPDCLDDRFEQLTTAQKAILLGCEGTEIRLPDGRDV